MKAKAKKQKKTSKRRKNNSSNKIRRYAIITFCLLLASFLLYFSYLNYQVVRHLDGDQWSLPSRVYARPLQLNIGLKLQAEDLINELNLLNYRQDALDTPGSYLAYPQHVRINRRAFDFPNQSQANRLIDITFTDGFISDIKDVYGSQLPQVSLDPVLLSSFYGSDGEDRIILQPEDIPSSLIDILIAVEDRQFYQHIGVNPLAIIRAFAANIKAGRMVQGGSTLTQQLAKNLFLSSDRHLWRKINDALYALILEWHMDKEAILTTYMNQVYIAQHKGIAIHGFALASQYLFRKPIHQLGLEQQALLVAMIKGPSYYNPFKNPERALKRRNVVIDVMARQNIIQPDKAHQLKQKPLGVVKQNRIFKRFPAFIDLLKKQLPSQYNEGLLNNSGLRIFTTLDPLIQLEVEKAVQNNRVLKNNNSLQAATILTRYNNGDIVAVVSDRNPSYPGFNRTALAQRPIGSLIKPFILYSLLENGKTLATKVEDKPITLKQSDGELWVPKNYDSKLHGEVSLYQALVYSYNLPFIRIGLDIGLKTLVETLERFNLQKNSVIYPSLLLGSIDLTPLEVAQLYQTMANDGVYIPLTTIRYVTDKNNQVLTKKPIQSVQLLNGVSTAQVQSAMRGVVEKGTAKALNAHFPDFAIAGKTGTTDGYKDSWFAGFTEQLLGIVWMGDDHNKPIQLTGSSGAMQLWADVFKPLAIKPLQQAENEAIEWVSTDATGQYLMSSDCEGSQLLPFKSGEQPKKELDCGNGVLKRTTDWFRSFFN